MDLAQIISFWQGVINNPVDPSSSFEKSNKGGFKEGLILTLGISTIVILLSLLFSLLRKQPETTDSLLFARVVVLVIWVLSVAENLLFYLLIFAVSKSIGGSGEFGHQTYMLSLLFFPIAFFPILKFIDSIVLTL